MMNLRRMVTPVLFAALVVGGGLSVAQAADAPFPADDLARLRSLIADEMAKQRQPGLVVGIWAPGRGTFVETFGKANLPNGTPMSADDHFRIASITKTFTAVAVLMLVDDGKLSLDDTLERYVPGIPNGDHITIRNLLGMTSGIYDFTADQQFNKDFVANPKMPFSLDDLIAIVKRHPPDFAPGAKLSYCDTNYAFLGVIIEKVSGKPAGEFITNAILKPLKLTETSYPTTPAMPAPFASGYYAGEDGKGDFVDVTESNPAVASTAGAMISDLADLRVWAKALVAGTLLSPKLHAEQMKLNWLTAPDAPLPVHYGLGIGEMAGLIGHNGAILGYTTAMFYVPKADAVIVVEGNQSSNSSSATTLIAIDIGKLLFPGQVK